MRKKIYIKRKPYTEPRAVHDQQLLPTVAYIATSNTESGRGRRPPETCHGPCSRAPLRAHIFGDNAFALGGGVVLVEEAQVDALEAGAAGGPAAPAAGGGARMGQEQVLEEAELLVEDLDLGHECLVLSTQLGHLLLGLLGALLGLGARLLDGQVVACPVDAVLLAVLVEQCRALAPPHCAAAAVAVAAVAAGLLARCHQCCPPLGVPLTWHAALGHCLPGPQGVLFLLRAWMPRLWRAEFTAALHVRRSEKHRRLPRTVGQGVDKQKQNRSSTKRELNKNFPDIASQNDTEKQVSSARN